MKIVDVCGFYTPKGGGVRTYVQQKLKQASAHGHDITVLAPGAVDEVEEYSPNARIRMIASTPFVLDRNYYSWFDEQAVHAAIDAAEPDIIEASSPWNSADYAASYPGNQPRVLVAHSDPLSAHAYRWFEKIAAPPTVDRMFDWYWQRLRRYGQAFEAIIAANSSLTQRLNDGGVHNAVTIPMGVEAGLFSPDLRDENLRARLLEMCDLGPDASLLVTAGRLATEKRVPMLVEAATIAGRQRPIGLAIFGEGRARAKILRAIAGNPHVRLLEPIRDRKQFATILASADALLHGCEAETFGMIAAEAHASGTPTVAPNIGGAGDFVRQHPELGYRPTETADVVRAILALPSPHERMPLRVHVRRMEDHFDELFKLYGSLIEQRAARAV